MGFKFKRVDLVAGSTEFPIGTDYATEIRPKSEVVLKKVVDAIIDCNCGWSLDNRNYVDEDPTKALVFSDIPCRSGANTYPGLFLTNSNSGCKLFVAYFGDTGDRDINHFEYQEGGVTYRSTFSHSATIGLCMSMIPGESDSVFGDPSQTSTFIPKDATRIIGTATMNSTWSGQPTFVGNTSSGYIYSWGVYVSDTVIAVSCNKNTATPPPLYTPVYMIGKIFGTLAHSDEDTLATSHYGIINFRIVGTPSYDVEGGFNVINYSAYQHSSPQRNFIGNNPSETYFSNITGNNHAVCALATASGKWVQYGSNVNSTIYPSDPSQLSGYVFNSTGNNKSRWCPYAACVIASDLDTYGVIPGDGFKGYIDTDLIRCSLGVYGQTFDNGNFICCDSTYNLLIGWDPSNTDSIAG